MQKKVNRPLATNQYLGIYIGQDVLFCLIYFVHVTAYKLPNLLGCNDVAKLSTVGQCQSNPHWLRLVLIS